VPKRKEHSLATLNAGEYEVRTRIDLAGREHVLLRHLVELEGRRLPTMVQRSILRKLEKGAYTVPVKGNRKHGTARTPAGDVDPGWLRCGSASCGSAGRCVQEPCRHR
jgi:hypothetical protein